MGASCELHPKTKDGKDSVLYTELNETINDRPLTNLIYASYLQEGVAAQMDAEGYRRNKNGEHRVKDVTAWFEVDKRLEEIGKLNLLEKKIKSKDSQGNYIEYNNAEETLKITTEHNSNSIGTVAYTEKQGDHYIIILEPRNSTNQIKVLQEEENYNAIQTTRQIFSEVGLSLDDIINNPSFNNLIDLSNIKSLFITLSRIKAQDKRNLSVQYLELLLSLNKDDNRVSRLMSKLNANTIEELAQIIYNNFSSPTPIITSQETTNMIMGLLDASKKFNNLDIAKAVERLNSLYTEIEASSYEDSIQKVIDDLNVKYGLDKDIIVSTAKEAKNVAELTSNIIFLLERQLKELEQHSGVSEETINIEEKINELKEALEEKRYYYAFSVYIFDVQDRLYEIQNIMDEYDEIVGEDLNKIQKRADLITKMKTISSSNKYILNLLSSHPHLLKEVGLNKEQIDFISSKATTFLSILNEKQKEIDNKAKGTMILFTSNLLGSEKINGMHASTIATSTALDSSMYDYLYCASKLSDPKGVVVGNLIRTGQDKRDHIMREIENRIMRATNKLRKAGIIDTSFMYEENGYIISNIDWNKYWKARRRFIRELKKRNLSDIEMKVELEKWEYLNTTEMVVDSKNNRTEVIPNGDYRKKFPDLTEEQKEYYDTMMQIKGEMGTLLPNIAQKQFVPPQIRRDFKDAFEEAKGFRGIWRAVLEKVKGVYTIWEDDADYTKSGILIDDENFVIGTGDLTGVEKNKIPLRYLNKIENQEELLKDFSGALQMFSGMAINYATMHEIASSVEFVYDYLVKEEPNAKDPITGESLVEKSETKTKKMFQLIKRRGTTKTAELVREIIDTQVYGKKYKDQSIWAKHVRNLIKYNSVRSLAVNVKGFISNLLVGELNALIEAGSSEYFGISDYIWAKTRLFGNGLNPGKIVDFITNTKNSYDSLLADVFDPLPGRFNDKASKRYYSNTFKHVLGSWEWTPGYSLGESMLNYTTMYAILHREKVLLNGKEVSLYEALDKTEKDGVSELVIKEGVTDLDGNLINLDGEYIQKIRRRIRSCNESMHGAMSEESKGVIHTTLWGKAVMNFRQWMVEFLSKRFRGEYIDANTKEIRIGYYREMFNIIKDLKRNDLEYVKTTYFAKGKNSRAYYNARRVGSELAIILILAILKGALDEPEERKGDFWYRMLIYQVDRALVDIGLGNPIGVPYSMLKLLNSPIPSTSLINDVLYPITGLGDITKEYQKSDKARGIEQGDNVYLHKLPRKFLPFYKHIDDLSNFSEDDSAFKYFE